MDITTAFYLVGGYIVLRFIDEGIKHFASRSEKNYVTVEQCEAHREKCGISRKQLDDKTSLAVNKALDDLAKKVDRIGNQVSIIVGVFQAEGKIFNQPGD